MFKNADFITSCYQLTALPEDEGGELIFLGRSNVGKSSSINRLCGKKVLARTSKTPGRTQCLNVFSIGESARLVDAPGYGFAKVPEAVKRQWQGLIMGYCQSRESLRGVVVVMDIRHPLQPKDREWLDLVGGVGVPVVVVLNKMDCLGRMQQKKSYGLVERYCREHAVAVKIMLISCRDGTGVDMLREYLTDLLLIFP